MFSKFAAVIAAGVLVATGLATSATAAAPFTDTVRISGNYDNGNHGYWASLAYSRTVTIQPTADADVWTVALRDVGSFTTIRNAKSPEAGADLGSPVTGRFTGRYDFTVTSQTKPSDDFVKRAYDFRCNPAGSGDRTTDCPGMPKSTGEWPALYFPKDATVEASAWRWEYRTCAETWVNSSTGNSGDITGKRCDRPVRADEPTAKDPACDAAKGTLTVPDTKGVRYEVNGHTWRAGTYNVRPGVYRVTAHARDGYRLVGDERWRLKVEQAEACPSPSPTPTVTPTVTVSPTPTDTPEVREVTPKAPKLTQATCDDKTASVAIPEVEGVVYKTSSGKTVEQGKTYSVNPGSVTITAEAADGYELADGAESEWTLVVSEAPEDCPTATPTTTTHVTVVNNIPVPSKVDTGLGGLARH